MNPVRPWFPTLPILLLAALIGPGGAPAAWSAELTGLWKARQMYGPEARGPLIVERSGASYVADMRGRRVPMRAERGELTFELPGGQGAFRGRLDTGGDIRGHWFPARSNTGGLTASPVRLAADGRDRWRGTVEPLDDVYTFFLLVEPRADGSLRALLRNPERDFGTQMGVRGIVREDTLVKLLGRTSGDSADREVARGTYDPQRDVLTLVFPARGGSFDFRREGDESEFYPRGKNPGSYTWERPLARDDGWPTGTLEDAGIDREAMERFVQRLLGARVDTLRAPQVHAILVARHGKLVLEEYFHGEHRDKLHDTRSASKSLTATLIGAAMEAGVPLRLSSPVYQVMNGGTLPSGLEERKRAMTLEHLLTMSAGYFCDDTNPNAPGNEDGMQEQSEEPDFYRYTMRVPMASAPGEQAVYCSASPNLALGMLGRTTGESPLVTFDRLLADPLGITRYSWYHDPAGNPYGGGGVRLLSRDFLKMGQLMLDGGTWHGKRILGRDFVTAAMTPHFHLRNVLYGYLWWGVDYPYKDRTVRAWYAGGSGGQAVTVIPELDLVIANQGGNYFGGMRFFHEYVARSILPAVREAGDDPKAPVAEREYNTPYGTSAINGPVSGSPSASSRP